MTTEDLRKLRMGLVMLNGADPMTMRVLRVAIRISLAITTASPEDRAAIREHGLRA